MRDMDDFRRKVGEGRGIGRKEGGTGRERAGGGREYLFAGVTPNVRTRLTSSSLICNICPAPVHSCIGMRLTSDELKSLVQTFRKVEVRMCVYIVSPCKRGSPVFFWLPNTALRGICFLWRSFFRPNSLGRETPTFTLLLY